MSVKIFEVHIRNEVPVCVRTLDVEGRKGLDYHLDERGYSVRAFIGQHPTFRGTPGMLEHITEDELPADVRTIFSANTQEQFDVLVQSAWFPFSVVRLDAPRTPYIPPSSKSDVPYHSEPFEERC